MRFTIHGVWQGRDVAVTWDEGRLEGPDEIVGLFRYHADLRRQGLGPPLIAAGQGPVYDRKGLTNPMAAILLAQQLLDHVVGIGDGQGPTMEMRARSRYRAVTGGRRRG